MKYSVYRPELKVYDYYETSPTLGDAQNPTSDDVARRCPRDKSLGVASDRAGYRLPPGARRIGQGEAPQGMIVTMSAGGAPLGSIASDLTFGSIFTLAAVGGGLMYAFRKKLFG